MGRVIKFFEDVGRLTIKLSETISTKQAYGPGGPTRMRWVES